MQDNTSQSKPSKWWFVITFFILSGYGSFSYWLTQQMHLNKFSYLLSVFLCLVTVALVGYKLNWENPYWQAIKFTFIAILIPIVLAFIGLSLFFIILYATGTHITGL